MVSVFYRRIGGITRQKDKPMLLAFLDHGFEGASPSRNPQRVLRRIFNGGSEGKNRQSLHPIEMA